MGVQPCGANVAVEHDNDNHMLKAMDRGVRVGRRSLCRAHDEACVAVSNVPRVLLTKRCTESHMFVALQAAHQYLLTARASTANSGNRPASERRSSAG